MSEDTKEIEAKARARQFIKDKGFTDSFIQEEVESFIVDHDKKYGHIVLLDELKTHKYETKAIGMIADKVGVETLIRSAWESDEEMLQKAYIESEKEPEEISRQNFLEVDESIKKLKSLYEYEKDYLKYNQKSSEVIDNLQNILGNKEKEASASLKSPASWKVPASLKTEKETDAKSGEENTHSSEGIKESKKGGLEDVLDAGINRSLFDKAIHFAKGKLSNIKDKIIGDKEEHND